MTGLHFKEIGARARISIQASTRPLAIYGTEELPSDIPHLAGVNRVLLFPCSGWRQETKYQGSGSVLIPARAVARAVSHTWDLHLNGKKSMYFVSTGRVDVRGGAAEVLKIRSRKGRGLLQSNGEGHTPGKYLVISACDALPDPSPDIRSVCCFGTAEQVRNMAALVHFDRDDPFSPVIVPWGPSCATFISYPAGLAANAPANTAFMGPQDPTQNHTLPPDMMALGIPADLAARMVKNLDASFITRRPKVAFPNHGKH